MLQELVDESENHGLEVNKSNTKVVIENDTPIYVNNTQIENVESYTYLGQRYRTTGKKQATRFKEESRPDGQHSPSTATSSRVTLEHAWRDKSTTHAHFQQWHTGQKHGHSPPKQRTSYSSRTNKDGKEYVKHHIPGQKNKHQGQRKDTGHRSEHVRRRK